MGGDLDAGERIVVVECYICSGLRCMLPRDNDLYGQIGLSVRRGEEGGGEGVVRNDRRDKYSLKGADPSLAGETWGNAGDEELAGR